ncbi:MAG: hypothetical protein H6753_03485 [Candidatus Omnitrophica bacterium]|nr:hypothetical protein [Candidatus Omnitrophota bacterium]
MFNYCLKVLIVSFITFLGFICPAFAVVRQQMDASAQYFDDLQDQDTLESYKVKHDFNTQRIREKILQTRLKLKRDRSDLAKAVIERKVRIVREREFLVNEFEKGVDRLYQKAVEAFEHKQYLICQKDLAEVEKLLPNYLDTRQYLEKLSVLNFSVLKNKADVSVKVHSLDDRQKLLDEALLDMKVANILGDQK